MDLQAIDCNVFLVKFSLSKLCGAEEVRNDCLVERNLQVHVQDGHLMRIRDSQGRHCGSCACACVSVGVCVCVVWLLGWLALLSWGVACCGLSFALVGGIVFVLVRCGCFVWACPVFLVYVCSCCLFNPVRA